MKAKTSKRSKYIPRISEENIARNKRAKAKDIEEAQKRKREGIRLQYGQPPLEHLYDISGEYLWTHIGDGVVSYMPEKAHKLSD